MTDEYDEYDEYTDEAIDDEYEDESTSIAPATPHDIRQGPVGAQMYQREYDNEALAFLTETLKDDFYPIIIGAIQEARLTRGARRRLIQLAREFTTIEIVVTNLSNTDRYERILRFRSVLKAARVGLRGIDLNTEFLLLLAQLEEHYTLKLTRAKAGFERIQQQSIHQTQMSSHENKRESAKQQNGIGRMLRNFGRK